MPKIQTTNKISGLFTIMLMAACLREYGATSVKRAAFNVFIKASTLPTVTCAALL